jgi:hypothetical protein
MFDKEVLILSSVAYPDVGDGDNLDSVRDDIDQYLELDWSKVANLDAVAYDSCFWSATDTDEDCVDSLGGFSQVVRFRCIAFDDSQVCIFGMFFDIVRERVDSTPDQDDDAVVIIQRPFCGVSSYRPRCS